jgi:hypothetical protein
MRSFCIVNLAKEESEHHFLALPLFFLLSPGFPVVCPFNSFFFSSLLKELLTNKRQPDKHEAHQRQHRQRDPKQRLDIVCKPEKAAVGSVDGLCAGLAAFKHPLGIAARWVDLVPPAQADEAAPCNVLKVVEVGGEEEDGDDEDEDPRFFLKKNFLPISGGVRSVTFLANFFRLAEFAYWTEKR